VITSKIVLKTKWNQAFLEDKDVYEKLEHTNPRKRKTIVSALARLIVGRFGRGRKRSHETKRGERGRIACCSARSDDGIYTTQCSTRGDKYASEQKGGKDIKEGVNVFAGDRPTRR